jgi:ABC-type transporter Mla subunit MlaD
MTEPTIVEETTVTETPVKAPKVKDRTLEELATVAPKMMTPTELKKYVDYLRDANTTLTVQLNSLKDAFTGVQKQKEAMAQTLQQYKTAANTQVQFCKDTVAQAYKTLLYMQPLNDIFGGIE